MAAEPEFASPAVERDSQCRDACTWRLFGTALSFILFGLGALVVGALLLPLVRVLPGGRERRRRRARAVMRASLRLFVAQMRAIGVLTYEVRGIERLGRPGQLIVANHPSLIDVVFLLAFTPAAGCVVKRGLWRNPLTRAAVQLAEYIPNDPTAAMIEAAAAALASGQSVVMFPEGTRTAPGQPPLFHRGAASIALRARASVTPVYIDVAPTTLTKTEPWYRIARRRPHFTLTVGAELELPDCRAMPLPRASRALNEQLHARFRSELGRLYGHRHSN